MNLQAKQMTEYFKENSSYKRLLKCIKNKYITFGEIKGNVIINNPDTKEKEKLSGLMKKDYSKNKSITINLKSLQEIIDNSRFSGASLKEILIEYFNEEIITKKESKIEYEVEIAHFFDEILSQNVETKVYKYIEEIIKNKDDIYYNLKKQYNKDRLQLKKALINACNGINNLPKEKMRIPIFASNITGNPHEFDKNTLTGRLFIMLLCYINKIGIPKKAEELSEIYYNNNLLIDDVSNMVLCKNITGFKKEKEYIENGEVCIQYEQHEGIKGFAKYNEPIYLNLYNLSNISFLSEYNKYNKVLVMENPAVFMEVSENCEKRDFPLVCTYGQVKLSGLILLDMFAEQNFKIYYSGDIDPEGIQIADKLKQRYNNNLEFIGFDANTYRRNLSDVELCENRLNKLDKIKSDDLHGVCAEVKLVRKASYEESNIKVLLDFINNI